MTGGKGHPGYLRILREREKLHLEKSSGYGTADNPFENFDAVARLTGLPRWLYPIMRAEEKLTRVASLYQQGRFDEIEDELLDASSCLDCATAMKREDDDSEGASEGGHFSIPTVMPSWDPGSRTYRWSSSDISPDQRV